MKRRDPPTVESILRGETAGLARCLTLVEREDPAAADLLEKVRSRGGNARRVVVTGAPGVGKSSLLREIMRCIRRNGDHVAVVACDPASTYTGGALLGDRVRWSELGGDSGVFTRSLAQRERSSTLPESVWRFAEILDAAGYPWIFIETVGAGQTDVAGVAERSIRLVVLAPGWGDEVQMLKAGLLEAGDIYVVNKIDLPGGIRWARQLEETLGLNREIPPTVIGTAANTGQGVAELVRELSGFDQAAPGGFPGRDRGR